MKFLMTAYRCIGVKFNGTPLFIHHLAILDATGGLELGQDVVIAVNAIILTHDYSVGVGLAANTGTYRAAEIMQPVRIGNYSFIGAGAILLPGADIGDHAVVGAGAVVKSAVNDGEIVAGNPAKVIGNTREWGQKIQEQYETKLFYRS